MERWSPTAFFYPPGGIRMIFVLIGTVIGAVVGWAFGVWCEDGDK